MALTDFWEIKDNQVFAGKAVLNVYHVKRILAGANAGNVGVAFLDWVVSGDLDVVQPAGLTRTTIEIANLGDPTDFATMSSSAFPGIVIGQELPGFNSATIQFNRTRNDMKNGRKGYVAGTENEQADGVWVAGFLTLLTSLAGVIVDPWEEAVSPGVKVCEFTILRRFCVVPAQDPCLQYRLPNTTAEIDAWHYVPTSTTTRNRVRSQVSRKRLI